MQFYERPRFLLIRRASGLTSERVAQEAGLSLYEEYRAELGNAVEPEVAERLAAAFSRLTGKAWTVQETAIRVRGGDQR